MNKPTSKYWSSLNKFGGTSSHQAISSQAFSNSNNINNTSSNNQATITSTPMSLGEDEFNFNSYDAGCENEKLYSNIFSHAKYASQNIFNFNPVNIIGNNVTSAAHNQIKCKENSEMTRSKNKKFDQDFLVEQDNIINNKLPLGSKNLNLVIANGNGSTDKEKLSNLESLLLLNKSPARNSNNSASIGRLNQFSSSNSGGGSKRSSKIKKKASISLNSLENIRPVGKCCEFFSWILFC